MYDNLQHWNLQIQKTKGLKLLILCLFRNINSRHFASFLIIFSSLSIGIMLSSCWWFYKYLCLLLFERELNHPRWKHSFFYDHSVMLYLNSKDFGTCYGSTFCMLIFGYMVNRVTPHYDIIRCVTQLNIT